LSGLFLAMAVAAYWWGRRERGQMRRLLQAEQRRAALLKAEHEQIASQILAQQQAVFNSMVEGVLVLDSSQRVQLVNQSLQRLFSLPEVRGQTILETFRLPELSDLAQRLQQERTKLAQVLEL